MQNNSSAFISWSIELLPRAQAAELREHVEASSLPALKRDSRWRAASAVSFACEAARRDGNSYTFDEALDLLRSGRTAAKAFLDALKILQLQAAYLAFVDQAELPEDHGDGNKR